MYRVVWDLPTPVRTAHTDTTGLVLRIIVLRALGSQKSAPDAMHDEPRCITCSCRTSE